MVNTLFSYRKTKCSDRVEQSVHTVWNRVFSIVKQSVRHSETNCSARQNKLFCVLKQAPILGENGLFLIQLDAFCFINAI